jgi:GPI mannosyltransferase 1 subunit M
MNCNVIFIIILAILLRIGLTIYGIYHDEYLLNIDPTDLSGIDTLKDQYKMIDDDDEISFITKWIQKYIKRKNKPRFTDIDYKVFTDAAQHVSEGRSPYRRATYRYSPLLAIILQPNVTHHEAFGKFLFIIFDILCGLLVIGINNLNDDFNNNKLRTNRNLICLCVSLFNPITMTISCRGNAESLMSFLVLLFIYFIKKECFSLAGLTLALAVHLKIYPITYGLAILLYIINCNKSSYNEVDLKVFNVIQTFLRRLFNVNLFKFAYCFIFGLLAITWYFYEK